MKKKPVKKKSMKKKPAKKKATPAKGLPATRSKATFRPPKTLPPVYNSNEKWLDKQDIMQLLHVSSRTLQTWRRNGIIRYSKIRRKFYYPESGLQDLLNSNMQ
jgi:helix-turn-helix protein